VVYTSKDPSLPEGWHTKQNVRPELYIVENTHSSSFPQVYLVGIGGGKPKELTDGYQGATHSPVFNPKGNKVAWLELDRDGYESDRFALLH
jgi:Tol biopolymer transport system component